MELSQNCEKNQIKDKGECRLHLIGYKTRLELHAKTLGLKQQPVEKIEYNC